MKSSAFAFTLNPDKKYYSKGAGLSIFLRITAIGDYSKVIELDPRYTDANFEKGFDKYLMRKLLNNVRNNS